MTKIRLDTQVQGVAPAGSTIDADLYKYQIVTSVNSGNLTVALKNYLGQDPSVAVPVKVQIGDTIRTITSALSVTVNAGGNWMKLGSNELTTKEVDLFTYLWVNNIGNIQIGIARIPYGNKYSDFSGTGDNEKYLAEFIGNTTGTNPVVNIGRFNAILSAGPSYTWSLGTGPIINQPIRSTRYLDFLPIVSGSNGGTGVNIDAQGKYKIIGNEVFIQIRIAISDKGSLSGAIQISTPFGVSNNLSEVPLNGFYSNYGINPTPGLGVPVLNQSNNCIGILVGVDTGAATFEDLTGTPRIRIKDSYNI